MVSVLEPVPILTSLATGFSVPSSAIRVSLPRMGISLPYGAVTVPVGVSTLSFSSCLRKGRLSDSHYSSNMQSNLVVVGLYSL